MAVIVIVTMIMVMIVSVIMSVIMTMFLSSLYVLKKDRLLTRSKSTVYRVTEFLDRCLELVL